MHKDLCCSFVSVVLSVAQPTLLQRFSDSMSGVLGSEDLSMSIVAGAIALAIVWAVLLLRYQVGRRGVGGVGHMGWFSISPYRAA